MPPTAGETTAVIGFSAAELLKRRANSAPNRSASQPYCSTSAHCKYESLCSPLVSLKWPWSSAPRSLNIFKTSSCSSTKASSVRHTPLATTENDDEYVYYPSSSAAVSRGPMLTLTWIL